jgi:hypothetical protein
MNEVLNVCASKPPAVAMDALDDRHTTASVLIFMILSQIYLKIIFILHVFIKEFSAKHNMFNHGC